MSMHALERIFQRYNKDFTWTDVRGIVKAIKEEKCVFLDAAKDNCITVLVNYDHIPLKLVYSCGKDHKGIIVTALPLDVEEWNKYLSQIPFIKRKEKRIHKNKKGESNNE